MTEVRDIRELGPKHSDRMIAARYTVHKIRAHGYALMVLSSQLTEEQAREEYTKAMENFDGIIAGAAQTREANEIEMAKGADAVTEMIEAFHNG